MTASVGNFVDSIKKRCDEHRPLAVVDFSAFVFVFDMLADKADFRTVRAGKISVGKIRRHIIFLKRQIRVVKINVFFDFCHIKGFVRKPSEVAEVVAVENVVRVKDFVGVSGRNRASSRENISESVEIAALGSDNFLYEGEKPVFVAEITAVVDFCRLHFYYSAIK